MTYDIYLAKQPIFNRQQQVVAYELLFRSGDLPDAQITEGDEATLTVLLNTLTNFGIEAVAGTDKVFVNLTRNLILRTEALAIPPEVGIEVLEDVVVDTTLLAALQHLKQKGHIISLDDFIFYDELAPLVALADIVKLDIRKLSTADLQTQLTKLKPYPVTLLAEKIETAGHLKTCQQLGFELFQGYFLSRPETLRGQATTK